MTRIVLRFQGMSVGEKPLKPGRNLLGRSNQADVYLDDPGASRNHCELWLSDDQLLLRDLGSTNGTYLDGCRVQEVLLQPHQTLRIGMLEFAFRDVPCRVAIPAPAPPPPEPPREMSDGTPCCRNHPETPAQFFCSGCGKQWCAECVRILGLQGGRKRAFCPECDAPCAFRSVKGSRPRAVVRAVKRLRRAAGRCYQWVISGP